MISLIQKPLLLALILCVPLWILTGSFILALMIAAFISLFLAMCNKLWAMSRRKKE